MSKSIIRKGTSLGGVVALVLAIYSPAAFCAPQIVQGKITRLTTDSTNYGGCLGWFDADGQADLGAVADCNNLAVSFGCEADPALPLTKSQAAANWSAAQLAHVTDKQAYVVVQDNWKYGAFCTVQRIDNLPN